MTDQSSQPPVIADDEATGRRALDAIKIIYDAYADLTNAGKVVVQAETSHLFFVVFGWWARVNRSGLLVALAHEAGLDHESGATVRVIMQHVLTMQWVIDTGDEALIAIDEHGDDNKRRLLHHVSKAGWDLPVGANTEVPPTPEAPHHLKATFKNFADLCHVYDAGILYIPYCLLSSEIHPSRQGAQIYIDNTGTLNSQSVNHTYGPLIQTAICLIQAAHTIKPLLAHDQLDSVIVTAEKRFGSPIDLPKLRRSLPGA